MLFNVRALFDRVLMFEFELYGRVVIFLNEVGAMLKRQLRIFQ